MNEKIQKDRELGGKSARRNAPLPTPDDTYDIHGRLKNPVKVPAARRKVAPHLSPKKSPMKVHSSSSVPHIYIKEGSGKPLSTKKKAANPYLGEFICMLTWMKSEWVKTSMNVALIVDIFLLVIDYIYTAHLKKKQAAMPKHRQPPPPPSPPVYLEHPQRLPSISKSKSEPSQHVSVSASRSRQKVPRDKSEDSIILPKIDNKSTVERQPMATKTHRAPSPKGNMRYAARLVVVI
jgi:hypothetical protein